jgi:hypothetical protein
MQIGKILNVALVLSSWNNVGDQRLVRPLPELPKMS